jgi:hypothetical protein
MRIITLRIVINGWLLIDKIKNSPSRLNLKRDNKNSPNRLNLLIKL